MHAISGDLAALATLNLCRNMTSSMPTASVKCSMHVIERLASSIVSNENAMLTFSVAILLGWILLVVASTFWPHQLFGTLSLKISLSELFTARKSRLDVLDVFRVVAIVWVIANHLGSEGRIDILERKPTAQAFKDAVHNHPVFGALLGNSALGVEIFLVLSGLLAARSWHRESSTPFLQHAFTFLVKRVFRILPIVAFFIFIAAGPIMKALLPRFHSSMISTCGRQGIVSHLTLTSNWQPTPTCLGYLWYLGLDMQLYLMAPFLLHFLYKHPRMALFTTSALIAISAAYRAVTCRVYGVCNKSDVDIPFISFPGQDPETVRKIYEGLWDMYGRPCTKCGPFLLGLILGCITNSVKLTLPAFAARKMFVWSLAVAVATIYGILPEYWYPEQGDTVYNTLYTALFRTVFASAVVGMIFSLFYNESPTIVSPVWSVLAKLTFNVYLLHMPTVYIFNFVSLLQTTTSAYVLVLLLPFVCALSFAFAFVFYCFVEGPLSRISSQILKRFVL